MEKVPAHRTGPRLLIADDHALFAEALRDYLEKTDCARRSRYGGGSHAAPT